MKIGDFARLGQVSVRMLRHYDALGLLRPERVDPWTGYRDYGVDQLAVLHRIVALKDLGLTLEEVGRVLADDVGVEGLRALLVRRRGELEAELLAGRARLAGVERRLRLLEEDVVDTPEIVVKPLPARRIAGRAAVLGEGQTVPDVVEPLFVGASRALAAAGLPARVGVALYDLREGAMRVTAGYDVDDAAAAAAGGLEVVDLPPVDAAACVVHLGPLDSVGRTWSALHAWLDEHGLHASEPGREVYLEAGPGPDAEGVPERTTAADQAGWVTELQQPVARR